MRKALTLLAALAALTACGGDEPDPAAAGTPTSTPATTAPATTQAEDAAARSNCFAAGLALLDAYTAAQDACAAVGIS